MKKHVSTRQLPSFLQVKEKHVMLLWQSCPCVPFVLLNFRVEKLCPLLAFPVKILALDSVNVPEIGSKGSKVNLNIGKEDLSLKIFKRFFSLEVGPWK